MRDVLIKTYLDFLNNYVSFEKYAEHNGLHYDQAWDLIQVAKRVYESKHPEK